MPRMPPAIMKMQSPPWRLRWVGLLPLAKRDERSSQATPSWMTSQHDWQLYVWALNILKQRYQPKSYKLCFNLQAWSKDPHHNRNLSKLFLNHRVPMRWGYFTAPGSKVKHSTNYDSCQES